MHLILFRVIRFCSPSWPTGQGVSFVCALRISGQTPVIQGPSSVLGYLQSLVS